MPIIKWITALAASLVAATAGASTITYYHNDLAGSPVAATDSSGHVIWRESYRPYGERLTNSASATDNSIWFTSHRQDRETGLVYMGARYYDPMAGRFVSMDPKTFDEANLHSFNRYAYANNNPYKYVDPDGKSPLILWAVGGYGAGVLADAASQYAAWGSVDWKMAMSSSAALSGAGAGLMGVGGGGVVGLTIEEVGVAAASEVAAAGKVRIVARDGTEITGITMHGIDRVIGDGGKRAGTRPEAILDALKNPANIKQGSDKSGRPFKIFSGENARVIINPKTGKIVSTNPLKREGANLP